MAAVLQQQDRLVEAVRTLIRVLPPPEHAPEKWASRQPLLVSLFKEVNYKPGGCVHVGEAESWTNSQRKYSLRVVKEYEWLLKTLGVEVPDTHEAPPPAAVPTLPQQETFVDFQNGKFLMRLNEQQENLMGHIHKLKYDKKSGLYSVIYRMEPVRSLHRFCKQCPDLHVTEAARNAVVGMYETMRARYKASKAEDAEIDMKGFGLPLYPFQRAGIKAACEFERGFIADEMGLGKTRQGLGFLWLKNARPAVIIAPLSVVLNWAETEGPQGLPGWKLWYPKSKKRPVHNCPRQKLSLLKTEYYGSCDACQFEQADVIVLNRQKLADGWKGGFDEHGKKIPGWKKPKGERAEVKLSGLAEAIIERQLAGFIIDESHHFKDGAVQCTKAAKEMVKGTRYRLLLSGTPIKNKAAELGPQLDILDRLDDFGGYTAFHEIFCAMAENGNTDSSQNESTLNQVLRGIGFVQRNKRDVLKELPPVTESTITVELDNVADYEKCEKDTINWCAEQAVKKKEFLDSIKDLDPFSQQAAIEKKMIETRLRTMRAEAMIRITALKRVAALGKLTAVTDWIEEFQATGQKLVAFLHHREIGESLAKKFQGLTIFGRNSAQEKHEAVKAFQSDKTRKTIFCSYMAAAEGVTLTAASHWIGVEQMWTPAEHAQALARVDRPGQTLPVNAYWFLGKLPPTGTHPHGRETIDHKVYRVIERKKALMDAVVRGEISKEEADDYDPVMEIMEELGQ